MSSRLPIFLTVLLCLSNFSAAGGLSRKAQDILKKRYGKKISVQMSTFNIPANLATQIRRSTGQKFLRKAIRVWTIDSAGVRVAYAAMDNVMGKEQAITFLILITPGNRILHCRVLKYRESWGGAVQGGAWNRQFMGKGAKDSFEMDRGIDGISGATISVRSLSTGYHKIVLLNLPELLP